MRVVPHVFNLILFASLAAGASLASPAIQQARDLYYRGIYGDKSAGEQAGDLFEKLRRESPDSALVEVYYGSERLLEAQRTWAVWKKNSLSKEGIQLMDEAVKKEPDNLEIRFVRAATERNLPSFFGRKEQAASDFDFIVKRAPDAVRQGKLEDRLAAASFFYYGEWCRENSRLKDAEDAWKKAIDIAPDSNGARKSSDELNKLEKGA